MAVDERVVARQKGVIGGDIADAAHIRRQLIDVVHAACGLQAALEMAQIRNHEFVGVAILELRPLDIHAPHPVALRLQPLDEVMADKAAGPGNNDVH